jgi:hypothetical protein
MAPRHVVVDGSNIATEGRSMPSLAQLDRAVREFLAENPDDVVTVVVDASFGHRIDSSELDTFEEAESAGELVSPPAGAIGRGDAFLLRIADKTGATVLSNDSFQEFHGEHTWLFDPGRLVGGKPVPGVGWIFTPRTPVRGPRSREAVKEATRTKKGALETPSAIPGLDLAAERSKGKGKGKKTVQRAIAVATEEAVEPKASGRRRRRSKSGSPPAEPVNEPLAFITFIAAHPLGSEVEGTVESFASHGSFVTVDGARCYVPLSAMGDPPPRSGREVFSRGDTGRFVIQALDPQRRGIELALPGFVKVAGMPTEETVEAEIAGVDEVPEAPAPLEVKPGVRRGRKAAPKAPVAMEAAAHDAADGRKAAPTRKAALTTGKAAGAAGKPAGAAGKAAAGKAAAGKAAAAKAAAAGAGKPAAAKKGAATKKEAAAKGAATKGAAVAKPAPTRKAAARKAATKKAAATKEQAPTKSAATKKPSAKKAATAKRPAPTKSPPSKTARLAKNSSAAGDNTAAASTSPGRRSPARLAKAAAAAKDGAKKAASGRGGRRGRT